ncbi:MAG: helix-turn-helix transcriptional regulator, partial [Clostridiales bacterium]|nr:helix-turn-helix transcriptional regulator [Clostridiales bacterium]
MFAKRLRELRIEKGLTQQKLADELKVDRTTVMKWERGERETNFTMLGKIADFFDTTSDYLI